MRWLLAATIGMGVLIVVGVVVLAVLAMQRGMGGAGGAPAEVTLREPPGTRMEAADLAGPDRAAVRLSGGGPDRVVVVDLKTGRIAATIRLAQ